MSPPDYSRVEEILFKGFLSAYGEVAGVPVVFKTVNQLEYDQILLYARSFDPELQIHLQECYFIAYSVFLFNRENVLEDRDAFVTQMVATLSDLPQSVLHSILESLQKLNKRAEVALRMVEAYSYGADSRQWWAMLKGNIPNQQTGMSPVVGINLHQRLWYHFNLRDDLQESFDLDWTRSKFEASVHSGEIKKIDSSDRTKKHDEYARRTTMYMTGHDGGVMQNQSEIKVSHESVDDLLGQLNRDMQGQKDFHDQIVSDHEKTVRERYLEKKAQTEARREQLRVSLQERDAQALREPFTKDPIIFYSDEDVDAITVQKREERRRLILSGSYAAPAEERDSVARMTKWGILDEDS